ncbi:LysR family transcriptional regulator [Streptosporangium sp. NPDC004379]|uniref:LysR family transcriptional regulator n=1 Tax=Streptosporangium sp. NPDC004379 TaxID=3366189 RepID=UPI003696565E
MLSLERLRVLHAISAHGSVTGAAEALHVTTSAISQQMAKLEREVGQRLLERNGRGVRLTGAAELLVAHAGRMLSLAERAEADLEAHRGAVVGRLTLAAFATAARGLVPPALGELRRDHPRLRVELEEAEPHETVPRVARGDLDMAIVQDWSGHPLPLPGDLNRVALLDDVADVALPEGHPLAAGDAVGLAELAGEPWITWSRGWICTAWLLSTLRSCGAEPDIAHIAAEHHTQLALVAAGLGVAIVPRLGRDPVPGGVRFAEVRPSPVRHVYAVWRADADRRPSIRAVIRALRRHALRGPSEPTASAARAE